MQNVNYDLLNYPKWNRRIINIYWLCNAIILMIEIVIALLYYSALFADYVHLSDYIRRFIVNPSLIILILTVLCEVLVKYLEKRRKTLQPYVVTFTCVAFCAVIITTHYSVNVIFVTCVIPIILSLAYNSERVLHYTYLSSLLVFLCVFLYLSLNDFPFLKFNLIETITNITIHFVVYLICKTILKRIKETIDTVTLVEQSAYEAKIAKEHAEEVLDARTNLLTHMSHEIRTPLNGIVGLSELALDDETLGKRREDYLVKIKDSANGLLTIVNNVLDVSKIDAGKMEMEKIPFDLHTVIKDCLNIIAHKADEKGLFLQCHDETELTRKIIGDPTKLRQALLNLLSNAVKFTEKGSVTFTLKQGKASKDENKVPVYFEISDTGIGIAKEQLKRIFEPYKQADDSITRKYGGTGLGLSITNGIIEGMGGDIQVESVLNKGTKFFFTLEFERFDEKTKPVSLATNRTMRGNRVFFNGEVLLCEDNEVNRQVARECLEKFGLCVTEAENGKVGIDRVRERERKNRPFDLIFMDVHMPVMDGLNAAKQLRKMNVGTPIIAMTADVVLGEGKNYANFGMVDYISKPFRSKDLWSCLLRHLHPIEGVEMNETLTSDETLPINESLGMEYVGDGKVYHAILKKFLNEQIETPILIENAVRNNDFSSAARIAHTAKSVSLTIGAVKLSQILERLEAACKMEDSNSYEEAMAVYKTELVKVVDFISNTYGAL